MGKRDRIRKEMIEKGLEKPIRNTGQIPRVGRAVCGKCFIRGGEIKYNYKTNMFEHVNTCPKK